MSDSSCSASFTDPFCRQTKNKKCMNSKFKLLGIAALLCLAGLGVCSCSEEKDASGPGLWVSAESIGTYPGDTVVIDGQASSHVGIKQVRLECEAWGLERTYDLSSHAPKVWNYTYRVCVPADAQFPQTLIVTTTNDDGDKTSREIPLSYEPTTEQPTISGLLTELAVDYDTSTGTGVLKLNFGVGALGILDKATVSFPQLGVTNTYPLSGRSASLDVRQEFDSCGTFDMQVLVQDHCGNSCAQSCSVVVMPKENEDEVEDYARMYAFTNESPDDYIYGYYIYMTRKDTCCYQVYVYAPTDDTEYFFSPTMETDGSRKFGTSPYVASKIISKQSEPGYVKGYKPGKGYWGLWVDLRAKTISKWALDPAEGDKSTLYYSADWNSWSFTAMHDGETEFLKTADITIYTGNQWFCLATTTDWTNVWRTWNDDGALAGWWFSADGSGNGAGLPTISADVEATITFDTLTKWCFIKKK